MVIAGFFAVAIFNSIEILIWIFSKFKRRKNFYFWSLVVAALGILIHSIAVFLRYFALAPNVLMCVFTLIGWWTMVTGQSFVMYSRLYLVVRDRRKIRWVLILIITNVFVLHLPVSILFLASNITHSTQFIEVFNIYERIQLIGFSIQESIISGLYVWEATHWLKPLMDMKGREGKRMIRHLIILLVITVLLDISLILTQFTNNFDIQTTYKPVVYSIKLKFEFIILNELIMLTRLDICAHPRPEDFSDRNRCQLASGAATTNPTPIHDGVQCVEDVERVCTAKSRTNHIFDGRFDSPAPSSSLEPAENNHHLPVVASDACSTVSEGTKQ
ncbi:hypothetical protein TGAM01_v203440 [Trichoderma gamsii]|uniref:DUF7703 domain-containing protein n=1 Tax=Trichoderma gamsii TaxID=398673 RepID=A0A2P4ZTU3_9HYPO|nr:hypothetical protein TGAM01_v203440 [Trichoderma gamsii]PON27673.1 hypothetical protein TGAM01_v203440 [Trichoderma gamsii]